MRIGGLLNFSDFKNPSKVQRVLILAFFQELQYKKLHVCAYAWYIMHLLIMPVVAKYTNTQLIVAVIVRYTLPYSNCCACNMHVIQPTCYEKHA